MPNKLKVVEFQYCTAPVLYNGVLHVIFITHLTANPYNLFFFTYFDSNYPDAGPD